MDLIHRDHHYFEESDEKLKLDKLISWLSKGISKETNLCKKVDSTVQVS